MSEAEFTAMGTSEKAMRVHEHYGEALAVDANGQLLSRYEAGIWKIIPPSDFHARRGRAVSASARPVLIGENCLGGGHPETDYSAAGRPGTAADWLSQRRARYQKRRIQPAQQNALAAHPVRRGFHPAGGGETLETHAPVSAGNRPLPVPRADKRDVILACAYFVKTGEPLHDWQLFLEVTGPGRQQEKYSGRKRPCSPGKITPRRPPSRRWNPHERAAIKIGSR